MAITKPIKNRIQTLKNEFDALKKGKESLLSLIDEAETPESVLDRFEGAMILVSHVPEFVEQIRIDETLDLEK